MQELVIRKLKEEDIDDVFKIEKSLIGECNKESIFKTLKNDNLFYYVLLKNNKIIGFFECQIIEPEIEIFDIAVIEEEQRKGFASYMMNYIISIAKDKKCSTIFLEVNSINNKAINFYKKFGFNKYLERKKYYGENDAILMKLELN